MAIFKMLGFFIRLYCSQIIFAIFFLIPYLLILTNLLIFNELYYLALYALYPMAFVKAIEHIQMNIPIIIEIYKFINRLNQYYYFYLYYARYVPYDFEILYNSPYQIIDDIFILTPVILYAIETINENKHIQHVFKYFGFHINILEVHEYLTELYSKFLIFYNIQYFAFLALTIYNLHQILKCH